MTHNKHYQAVLGAEPYLLIVGGLLFLEAGVLHWFLTSPRAAQWAPT